LTIVSVISTNNNLLAAVVSKTGQTVQTLVSVENMSSNMGVNNYMNMFVQPQNGDSSLNKRESSGKFTNEISCKKAVALCK